MRSISDILVLEHQDPEVSQDPTIAELIKLARKAKQNMVTENPKLQNLEEQMQSRNQKIQDLSIGLHRMEEMMSHRMEEMMSQMMELMKALQGKSKEPVLLKTKSNVNGTRVNPIEIEANSNEGRDLTATEGERKWGFWVDVIENDTGMEDIKLEGSQITLHSQCNQHTVRKKKSPLPLPLIRMKLQE
ncbi:hypothetical protein GH714_018711 [Hevea brasiliensis]|uniref:Uncharacterized protein n=1 Tax=Hevea brasiliensis TaxID=3981 RepID=A0A6A6NDE7_HEVBR|nr:hypothetical protein GH714_018711 [Hevea brasiliensis]